MKHSSKKSNLRIWAAITVALLLCPNFLYAQREESDNPRFTKDFSEGLNIRDGETFELVYTGSQPDPRALLRDTSGNSSYWGGTFWSNYNVIFVNTRGIVFGANANIQAASLIASTLNISNNDFLNGRYNFFKDGESAFIINRGNIKFRNGGYAILLSQAVQNSGNISIEAGIGTVVLAAGNEIRVLQLDDNGDISVAIDKAVESVVFGPNGERITSAVKNDGTIVANGGKVILTAKVLNSVFDYAVNNTGIIEAKNIVDHNGVIEITASGAPVINSGTLEAGKVLVDVTGAGFTNIGKIITDGSAELPNGGIVNIQALTILQKGLISANALEGGDAGEVSLVSEASTVLDEGSSTEARALGIIGNGGRILINSTNGNTNVAFGAVLDVSAGLQAGNGGFIDVSAFDQLGFFGILNGRAPPGYLGATVIFDPSDITIGSPINFTGNYVITSLDSVIINANITVTGNLTIIADSNNDTIGDVLQNTGIISAGGNVWVEGANVYIKTLFFGGDATNYCYVIAKTGEIIVTDKIVSSPGGLQSSTVLAVENNYTTQNNPTAVNSDTNNPMLVDHTVGSLADKWSWFKFNLGIPAGGYIENAVLSLYVHNDVSPSSPNTTFVPVGAYHSDTDTWSAATLNWNNQPTDANTLTTETIITKKTAGNYFDWVVTGDVQSDYATNGISTWAMKMDNQNLTASVTIGSNLWNNKEPSLKIDYFTLGSGTITLVANGYGATKNNITLGKLLTNGNVYVKSVQGAIIDRNDIIGLIKDNIKAGNLALFAATGIGSDNAIEIQASYLSALNSTSGNIKIDNNGNLIIADLSSTQVGNNGTITPFLGSNGVSNGAAAGSIQLGVHSNLNVDAPINSFGNVSLSVTGNIAQNADITINQNGTALPVPQIISSSHPIDSWLSGVSNDPTVDISWTIAATPGTFYSFTADAGGAYTQAGASTKIATNGGDAAITAGSNVTLTLIDAGNGDVSVTTTGLIIDGDLLTVPSDYDIKGRTITLTASVPVVLDYGQGGVLASAIDIGYPGAGFSYSWTHGVATPDSVADLYTTAFVSGSWIFSTTSTSPTLSDAIDWYFNVAAVDGLGVQSATANRGAFYIDTTAPTFNTLTRNPDPNEWGWNNDDVTVYYTASDDRAGLIPGDEDGSTLFDYDGENLSDTFTITDKAGNTNSLDISDHTVDVPVIADPQVDVFVTDPDTEDLEIYKVNIDTVNPIVIINSPEDGITYTDPQILNYTAEDSRSGIASTTPPNDTVYGEVNDYDITVTATDKAGNSANASLRFSVSTPQPEPPSFINVQEQLRYKFPMLEQMLPGGLTTYRPTPFDLVSSSDLTGPTYFYQPLTPTDISAFDSQYNIEEGAYDFMDGSINMKGHEGLLPILEDVKKKRKIQA
jgi:filamentous hemagglutinin family protein